jgi:hypothetical protein
MNHIEPYCLFELAANPIDRNRWGFGWGLEGGWSNFLRESLWPAYEFGFRRFVLHRPFGESDRGDHMDFDARLTSRKPATRATRSTTDVVRAFLERVHKEMPDARLTLYMGSINDDSFKGISTTDFLARMAESLTPWMDFQNVDLIMDNAASPNNYPVDSEWWAASELLRRLVERRGGTYWIEAVPWARPARSKIRTTTPCAWNGSTGSTTGQLPPFYRTGKLMRMVERARHRRQRLRQQHHQVARGLLEEGAPLMRVVGGGAERGL